MCPRSALVRQSGSGKDVRARARHILESAPSAAEADVAAAPDATSGPMEVSDSEIARAGGRLSRSVKSYPFSTGVRPLRGCLECV